MTRLAIPALVSVPEESGTPFAVLRNNIRFCQLPYTSERDLMHRSLTGSWGVYFGSLKGGVLLYMLLSVWSEYVATDQKGLLIQEKRTETYYVYHRCGRVQNDAENWIQIEAHHNDSRDIGGNPI